MVAETLPSHILEAIAADPHRPGSIDHALLDSQVLVTRANAEACYLPPPPLPSVRPPRPWLASVVACVTRDTIHPFQRANALRRWVAGVPRSFPEGGRATQDGFWGDFSTFLCGGTEEEVVRKGSQLAAELCRVLVLLAQIAGLPARIVFLYADEPPVRHAVVEVFVDGRWAVFDPVSDRSFSWPKHGYVSAWQLQQMPQLVDGLPDHGRLRYVAGRFYRMVALATYDPSNGGHSFCWDPLDDATRARLRAGEAS